MRIAIPIIKDSGLESMVSDHFGRAKQFAIYDSEMDKIDIIKIEEREEKQCTPVQKLEDLKLDAVYVSGLGWRAMNMLRGKGIKVKTGKYKTVIKVVEHLGKLEDLETACREGRL